MYISGEEEVMVLVSTSNEKVSSLIGKDFISSHLHNDRFCFSAVGLGKCFKSNVKRICRDGEDYVFVTTHSWYRFRLHYCEKLVMGCTVVQTI